MRPKFLKDFFGQEKIKKQLEVLIKSAGIREDILPHMLLKGFAGSGKTTLAHVVANEIKGDIVVVTPALLKTKNDLINLLESQPDIVFIDEIHGLSLSMQEELGLVMEDFKIAVVEDEIIGDDKSGKVNKTYCVRPFTLMGATTLEGLLSKPLRDRFKIHFQFLPYNSDEAIQIVKNMVTQLGLKITDEAAEEITEKGRGIPRILIRYTERIRDIVLANNRDMITLDNVRETFNLMDIDEQGFSLADLKVMKYLYEVDRPIGVKTLAIVADESLETVENVIEPFLIQKSMIVKTERGRVITSKGAEYLKGKEAICKGLVLTEVHIEELV